MPDASVATDDFSIYFWSLVHKFSVNYFKRFVCVEEKTGTKLMTNAASKKDR